MIRLSDDSCFIASLPLSQEILFILYSLNEIIDVNEKGQVLTQVSRTGWVSD